MMSRRLASDRYSTALIRLLLFVVLAPAEMVAITLLFVARQPRTGVVGALQSDYVRQLVLAAATAHRLSPSSPGPTGRRSSKAGMPTSEAGSWRQPLAVNLALFGTIVIATIGFSRYAATADHPALGPYCGLFAAAGRHRRFAGAGSRLRPAFWISLLSQNRLTIAVAAVVGLAAILAGRIAQTHGTGFPA